MALTRGREAGFRLERRGTKTMRAGRPPIPASNMENP